MSEPTARRIAVAGAVADPVLREQVRSRAVELGLLGWVRLMEDGSLCVHAEGAASGIEELVGLLRSVDGVESVAERIVRLEGHEQFAVRGVMRSWAVPKGPSLDPAVKRFAAEVEDHSLEHNDFEGRTGRGGVIIWDRGTYEQGGRVPWPEALERGHAVFVLNGDKLRGGFALQRTRGGEKPQWLMVKRRDEHARPGSDVAAERPESVQSGRTLDDLLSDGSAIP